MPNLSPVPYTGNKSCIQDTILTVMPPHKVYLEACMGSAEIFFRKRRSEKEFLNDYNGDLVNFFRVLQGSSNLALLIGKLYLSFNDEAMFRSNRTLLDQNPNVLDTIEDFVQRVDQCTEEEIDLAVAFYANQVYSFSSTGKHVGLIAKDMVHRFPRLLAASRRLREAVILHRDFRDAINFAASPETFILLDPPYKDTENYYSKSNFSKDTHSQLFGFMRELDEQFKHDCKFLITYNNDPEIRSFADQCGFDSFVQPRPHSMSREKRVFEELLIANYDLRQQAESNRLPILFEHRQMNLFDLAESNPTKEETT